MAHRAELRADVAAEIFVDYDLVLDGTDRFSTRYLINDACVLLLKPLISAAIHRFEGQAFTYVPGRGPCYRCLFPKAPTAGTVPNCAEAGVLGVLPGVLGVIQATEAIKLITGVGEPLIGRLLTYDALDMRFGELRFERRSDCEVCGDKPTITDLRDDADFCSSDVLAAIRRVSARELQVALINDASVLLVDVREPREYEAGHIADSINVPMSQLAARIDELPRNRSLIFACRSGSRSLLASGVAARAGFVTLAHLNGGLLGWAAEVDPSLRSRRTLVE